MNQTRSRLPIHPILFGFYPVLTLYFINIEEVAFPAIQQALMTAAMMTTLVCLGFFLLTRSWRKSAPLISFSLLMIFTYGHLYNQLEGTAILGAIFGRHRYLLPIWGVILVAGLFTINRKTAGAGWAGQLNTISIIMLGVTLAQIGIHGYQANILLMEENKTRQSLQTGFTAGEGAGRDVYFILLDAYSRQDLLRDRFNLDTTEFISNMQERGFYIPRCGQSNYFNTYPSMTATLNMNYLDAFGIDESTASPTNYAPLIQENEVSRIFEELGYQTITFKVPHPTIDINTSSYYFDFFENRSAIGNTESINFQYLFLKTTAFLPFLDYLENRPDLNLSLSLSAWIPVDKATNSREYRQYQQTLFALNTLKSLPTRVPGKKFVYAHLLITHQPFVFYPDGRFHEALPQDNAAYRDQVLFADKEILEIVDSLLEKSTIKPIIIIQSDHSYLPGIDRVKNFNAYYLPDGGNEHLNESITPVNTFRLLFNLYFGGDYDYLPDLSKYMYEKVGNIRDVRIAPPTCIGESP